MSVEIEEPRHNRRVTDLTDEQLHAVIDMRVLKCKTDIATELHQMNTLLTEFTKAFPHEDGAPDFGGHRDYHDSLIRSAKAQETFWNDLRSELLRKGIVWGLVILIGLIIVGIEVKLGLIPHPTKIG